MHEVNASTVCVCVYSVRACMFPMGAQLRKTVPFAHQINQRSTIRKKECAVFGLWEERKKAWNVSLLLRNEECVHVCLRAHLCVCNYTCEVGSSRPSQHSWAAVLLTVVEALSVFTLIQPPSEE